MPKSARTAKQIAAMKRWQKAGSEARGRRLTAMRKGLARMLTRAHGGGRTPAVRLRYKKASKVMLEKIKANL